MLSFELEVIVQRLASWSQAKERKHGTMHSGQVPSETGGIVNRIGESKKKGKLCKRK